MSFPSLTLALQSFESNGNLSQLYNIKFEDNSFPAKAPNGEWVFKHSFTKKEAPKQETATFEALFKEGLSNFSTEDQRTIISKVNNFFSNQHSFSTSPQSSENEIRFNSKAKGYEYLSNWHPTLTVRVQDGEVFPSVEAFFHDTRIKKFGGNGLSNKKNPPIDIKHEGDHFMKNWKTQHPNKHDVTHAESIKIITQALEEKFATNPHLLKLLQETGDSKLVEESTTSLHFGSTKVNGVEQGENIVGKVIMDIRDKYRK